MQNDHTLRTGPKKHIDHTLVLVPWRESNDTNRPEPAMHEAEDCSADGPIDGKFDIWNNVKKAADVSWLGIS
jgi:hypothetical protein